MIDISSIRQLTTTAGEEPPERDSDPDRRGPRRSAVQASPSQYAGKGEEARVLHRIGDLRDSARGPARARRQRQARCGRKDQAAALVDTGSATMRYSVRRCVHNLPLDLHSRAKPRSTGTSLSLCGRL